MALNFDIIDIREGFIHLLLELDKGNELELIGPSNKGILFRSEDIKDRLRKFIVNEIELAHKELYK